MSEGAISLLCLLVALTAAAQALAADIKPVIDNKVAIAFEPAELGKTTYRGWIHDRMQINVEKRLLQLDLDMILDPFVNRPGSQWWVGEHVGKYLHAATYAWRFTGDERLRKRMDYAVDTLLDTQLPNGYLGTYEEDDQFGWGDGLGWDGPVWDVWVHKYNLIGLLTYYQATGDKSALEASMRAADLMYETLVVKKRTMRLASAHMGMAATSVLEPMAILYRLTGEQRYLDFCHYVIDSWEQENKPDTWMYEDGCQLLTSLLEHGNVYKTANRKAYEMLSNLVGLLELYRVEPDERYLTACINAWKDIAEKRLYITGTSSYYEQFTPDHILPPGYAAGEGCVTVTWLQLNAHLLELTGEVQYADELERTTYNALLAAQSPHTGEVAYFVPLLGHKGYNDHDFKEDPPISCCSSSIPRGIAMIPRFASGTLKGKPALLQYLPGKHALHYGAGDNRGDVTLTVRGDYPRSGDLEIEVGLDEAARFPLVLRVPAWAKGFQAKVAGKTYGPTGSDRLMEIDRMWSPGDTVEVKIPLDIRLVPDGDKTTESVAFVRGPHVLATDTAIEAGGGLPESGWWGDDLYACTVKQNGVEKEFQLVNFADAGQHKEEYAVLHEGIEAPSAIKDSDPADEILAALRGFAEAMEAGDAAGVLDFYSEDWSRDGLTKEDLREYYEGDFALGGFKDMELLLDLAEVVTYSDGAKVGPVAFKMSGQTVSYTYEMKKESDGKWRVVYSAEYDKSFDLADEELKQNALAARALRERILSDPARPGYHFVIPEGIGMPFDPNGAIYWQGRYHLFYIFQDERSGRDDHHWGHVSSTDLFHWRHHPTGLVGGMFSGNAFINADGRPTMCYHQVGQGNAMAVALDDDLNEWKKLESNPITPKTEEGDEHHGKYKSWDPFGWLEGDTYYAIFGGGRPAVVKAPALEGEWEYVGDLFAHGVEGVSLDEDVSCADLFELGGKDVLLAISHRLGARYYVGEWKDEQFYPESHAQMSWVDNSFFAPESLVDDRGRRIMWAWIFDTPEFGVRAEHGWSGTLSLPRVLTLGDDGLLRMDVPEEIEALRYDAVKKEDLSVPAGTEVPVDGIGGNSLELIIDIESAHASQYGVKVCVSPDGAEETSIFYDAAEAKLKVDTRKSGPEDTPKTVEAAPFELADGERLKLSIFIDKSVVEVFANSRQAVMRRIYPSRTDSVGVRLFATGGDAEVHTLEAYKIAPSNSY
jgi:DUF1680 family protein/sucrose-6-phosphate hydrolase SacC (GH32 family)